MMRITHRSRVGSGFTLVELLTVVAILAILAALLLPALARSKELAKRAYCQNNLRELAAAMIMYGDEYSRYPPASTYTVSGERRGPNSGACLWNAYLLPYTERRIFDCPSFPACFRWTTIPSSAGYFYPTNIQGNRPFCYALNCKGVAAAAFGLGNGNDDLQVECRKPSEIRMPSDMICLGDDSSYTTNNPLTPGRGYKAGEWGVFVWTYSPLVPDGGRPIWIGTVHNQGGNMVFLDGHVEWQHWWKWIEFSDAAAQRWNYDHQPHQELWKTSTQ